MKKKDRTKKNMETKWEIEKNIHKMYDVKGNSKRKTKIDLRFRVWGSNFMVSEDKDF